MNQSLGGREMLEVSNLRKAYGAELVLGPIDYRFPRSGIVEVSGPNGSGKSVLLRLIAGFGSTSAGRISFKGKDIEKMSAAARRRLGIFYLPQSLELNVDTMVNDVVADRHSKEVLGSSSTAKLQEIIWNLRAREAVIVLLDEPIFLHTEKAVNEIQKLSSEILIIYASHRPLFIRNTGKLSLGRGLLSDEAPPVLSIQFTHDLLPQEQIENRIFEFVRGRSALAVNGHLIYKGFPPLATLAVLEQFSRTAQNKNRLRESLELLRVTPLNYKKPIREFSGGNRQKIAIAFALAQAPEYLLIVDLFRGLDISGVQAVVGFLSNCTSVVHVVSTDQYHADLVQRLRVRA